MNKFNLFRKEHFLKDCSNVPIFYCRFEKYEKEHEKTKKVKKKVPNPAPILNIIHYTSNGWNVAHERDH